MAQRGGKKRMTLSAHLALRAEAAREAELCEQERQRRQRAIEALEELPGCTCPACVRLRQIRKEGGA